MLSQPYFRGAGTAGITGSGTATASGVDDGSEVDAGAAVMGVKEGTLDDVEDLEVDVGVTVTGGVGLLRPGARLAMARWRRSAIRS